MTTFHLIRHGQTIWHQDNRYAGSTDIDLTSTGREQARSLKLWARSEGLDLVITSPLKRAVETSRYIASAAKVPLELDPRFREVDFGQAEGLTQADMSTQFPAALASFLITPASTPLPGGERGADALDRGRAALVELASSHPDSTVAIITHTTLIRIVLCAALHIPLDDYRRRFPRIDNATITTMSLHGAKLEEAEIYRINSVR